MELRRGLRSSALRTSRLVSTIYLIFKISFNPYQLLLINSTGPIKDSDSPIDLNHVLFYVVHA